MSVAELSAEPNPLPNMLPPELLEGFSLSSLAAGSGLNELCSLNGVEPKGLSPEGWLAALPPSVLLLPLPNVLGLPNGLDVLLSPPKMLGLSLFAADANGLVSDALPPPKTLPPFLLPPAAAKPPWFANPANPLEEDAAADLFASPWFWALPPKALPPLLAKLEKPDCPNAGADPPAAAQGEVLIPSCEDAPKALGFPNAGVDGEAGLPNEGCPKVEPPV